jgi:hypothetical protein
MGKDRVEKKEKRSEKKEKRADKDGVAKVKKEKKEKKDKTTLVDAVEKELSSQEMEGVEQVTTPAEEVEGDEMAIDRPTGAHVPFANPLVEDKNAKKVLKSVKKGKALQFVVSTYQLSVCIGLYPFAKEFSVLDSTAATPNDASAFPCAYCADF